MKKVISHFKLFLLINRKMDLIFKNNLNPNLGLVRVGDTIDLHEFIISIEKGLLEKMETFF